MAEHANSTPVPTAQIIPFPAACAYVPKRCSPHPDAVLPPNVVRIYAPRKLERNYTATSVLLGEIVSALTPRQFTQLTGNLRDRWREGDLVAFDAFNLGVEGAYVS